MLARLQRDRGRVGLTCLVEASAGKEGLLLPIVYVLEAGETGRPACRQAALASDWLQPVCIHYRDQREWAVALQGGGVTT